MRALLLALSILLVPPSVKYVPAAEPTLDPAIDWAQNQDPRIALPERTLEWPDTLPPLWRKALEHREADVQREAADSITRALQLGMPMPPKLAKELAETLAQVLQQPNQHAVARTAAARALVQLDARQTAELLAKHAARGPIELTQIVEPALARWDYQPQRDVWLQRLSQESLSEGSRPTLLHLAAQSLAVAGEQRAIGDLTRLAKGEREPASTRLAAARALGSIQPAGLEELAGKLAKKTGPTSLVDRLVAANLLAHHAEDSTLALLEQFADDPEPAVAAQAMQRLLEIAPQQLIARADKSLAHRDAKIRYFALAALATSPSPESIARIAPRLDDPVVENRVLARRTLLKMAADEKLHATVVERTTTVLAADAWRGDEQAILILTTLKQRQVGARLMELLDHQRPEVFVTAAWGLRKLAVPELVEPMFAAAKKIDEGVKSGSGSEHNLQLAQLLEAMGEMKHLPAQSHLLTYVPKAMPIEPRTAAIWSLGLLLDGQPDPALARQLEQRLADVGSLPPEINEVRAMSAITLGRMKSEASLPALRQWYKTHGHNDYVGRCCGWSIERMTGEKLPDPDVAEMKQGNWFLVPLEKQ
jgi:HEAT repeat protein